MNKIQKPIRICKRKWGTVLILGIVLSLSGCLSNNLEIEDSSELEIEEYKARVKLLNSKALALSSLAVIPIDPAGQNVTFPAINVTFTPEVPPGVNATLARNENRTLQLIVDDLEINAKFIDLESLGVRIGAHVRFWNESLGNFTAWTQDYQNRTTYYRIGKDFRFTVIEQGSETWKVAITVPLRLDIDLRGIIWNLAGRYPIRIVFYTVIVGNTMYVGDYNETPEIYSEIYEIYEP